MSKEKKRDELAVMFGRRGGLARGKKLSQEQRSESARKAALARWRKKEKSDGS